MEIKSNSPPIENINIDFIPYACHYDDETILTKQGELLKIIKLEDHSFVGDSSDLRTEIRQKISKNIDNSCFTIWIHTIRKDNKINLKWCNTQDFSDQLHLTWFKKLTSNKLQYVNELYIVILISNFNEHIHSSLFFNSIKNRQKSLLKKNHENLKKTCHLIKSDLEPFGAKILGLRYNKNNVFSEIMEFLYYIATFTQKEFPLLEKDISYPFKNLRIAFGFNTFQTIFENKQKFGCIFSVKEYREIPLDSIDKFLQLDCEMIITEIIIFTSQETKELKKQIQMLQASEDNNLLQSSGINEILNLEKTEDINFCQQKIILTLFTSDKIKLIDKINSLSSIMSTIGLMLFRTDLHLEDHFWAQLPGNFIFVTHLRNTLTKYAYSFAMLHNFTSGMLKGGRWKEAVTIFFSNKGDPYFFNFHGRKNNGHTTILGAPNSGRTSLINFLLSESRKFNPKILIFDNTGKSIIFTKAIGGKYYIIDSQHKNQSSTFNPLKIEDSITSRNMLYELIKRMVNDPYLQDIEPKIKKVVDSVLTIPIELRSIEEISEVLQLLGGNIGKWLYDGEFSYLLKDSNKYEVDWQADIISINTTHLTKNKDCMSVVLYYFLYLFEARCNGEPAILVLDEAWEISNIFSTEQDFDNWIKKMTDLNVVVILSTENLNLAFASKFTQFLEKHVDTKILMPNINANKLYMKAFSLSKEELNIILQTPTQEGLFLIKQYKGLVTLNVDLKNMKETHVLSASKEGIHNMYKAIKEKGDQVNEWLPVFYEKCKY